MRRHVFLNKLAALHAHGDECKSGTVLARRLGATDQLYYKEPTCTDSFDIVLRLVTVYFNPGGHTTS